MSDKKITELPDGGAVQSTDEFVAARAGGNVKIAGSALGGGSSSLPSGDGAPGGVVTPSGIGALYVDTTNGALYIAVGVTDADWICVTGNSGGGTLLSAGITTFPFGGPGGSVEVIGGADQAVLTDLVAANGSANGLYWKVNGADGNQTLDCYTGANGAHHGVLQDVDGNIKPAGTLDASNFPTADPHVAGQVWNNAGTLKVSAG